MLLLVSLAALAQDDPRLAVHDAVSLANIEHDVRALSGADALADGTRLSSRYIHHPHYQVAAAWLLQAFEEIDGLEVRTEAVRADGRDLFNIVAELPGTRPDLPWVVLGAHFDSIASLDPSGDWDGTVDPAPGADDDASGVSALLETARTLAAWEPGFEHPIRFVAFTAEEVGLVGSFAHVEGITSRDEEVRFMVAMDPIGYNPAGGWRLWGSYDTASASDATAMEETATAIGSLLDVTMIDEALFGGDERSDHYPFWAAGHPGVHVASFPQPNEYHTMADDMDVVDVSFLAEVADLVTVHAAGVAGIHDETRGACACTATSAPSWAGLVALLPLVLLRRQPHRRIDRTGGRSTNHIRIT